MDYSSKMEKTIYQEVLKEIKNKKSNLVFKRGENIYNIMGDLFDKVIRYFPPHLDKKKRQSRFQAYTQFFFIPKLTH